MEFLPEAIESYSQQHTQSESELLKRINRETWAEVLMPRMLSGHMQGRILSMFSRMIRPLNILEIGTYTGYSALCLAEGLQPSGKLFTIDINDELESRVRGYFRKSRFNEQIDFRIGDAVEIIKDLSGPFDLVFIDADKVNYAHYFDLVIDKVRSGGFIIADNVLWSGKVTDLSKNKDEDTLAIDAYNKKIHTDTRVEHVLMPVRDGLMVCCKTG
jgi:caffeoyl-CoA O-methyltransferase